ncbi:hypothetical protein Q1695_005674 [Nippostrongylus brasiliensis]|nr:hypothetical protein Q1695_005674 [Nippostrongylus brasiliensis]
METIISAPTFLIFSVLFWDIATDQVKIYVGTACTHPEFCTGRKVYEPYDIRYHEHYDPCLRKDDLAVIELYDDIPTNEASSVCMPAENEKLVLTLTAVGYGADPTMHSSERKLFNWLQAVDLSLVYESIPRKIIRTRTYKRSLCYGDSGGPLIKEDLDGRHTLVGIATSIRPECNVSPDAVSARDNFFIDVRSYLPWICEQTGVCPGIQQNGTPNHIP